MQHHVVDSEQLPTLYREPSRGAANKAIDHVDRGVRAFLARSPLFVLATGGPGGLDASPRGGPPGFVVVLDDHHIAFGDLSGNNRIDSYRNIVDAPMVGMLFLVPGLDETLRVNGTANITVDASVREQCRVDGRVPKVAVVVRVSECFVHCAKALRRGRVWDPSSWLPADELPSPAAMLNDHLCLGLDPAVIAADLEEAYATTLWEPGGE